MRSKKLQDRRNQLIYDQYVKLWTSGLREERIWPELMEAFHLQEKTIYRIVLKFIKNARKANNATPTIPEEPNNANN